MHILSETVLLVCLAVAKGDLVNRTEIDVNRIPDAKKLTVDFVRKYGYPAEMHEFRTKDNYVLTIHRIPNNGRANDTDRPVVLLQHGIVLSSDQWVLRGTEDLVFLLSEQGYDVWMSNTRGTQYSRHRIYSKADYKFWNYRCLACGNFLTRRASQAAVLANCPRIFELEPAKTREEVTEVNWKLYELAGLRSKYICSLDELGNYDLPAIIDYILSVTGKPHLTYIGHSRGVAMAVILLSSQPEYNAKINLFLGIAPVIYSKEAKCPIYQLAGNRPSALMKTATLQQIFQKAQVRNLLFTTKNMRRMLHTVCKPGAILDNVCPYISFFINGEDFQMFNKTLFPLMISHFTLGVAAKELIHLLQISESDIFRRYDYGRKANLQVYGSEEPQAYNFNNIRVPTYLYYGPNDLFVSERDLFKFADQLPNFKGAYRVPYSKFNHIDYIFAKNANELLYPHIIKVINKYNNKVIAS